MNPTFLWTGFGGDVTVILPDRGFGVFFFSNCYGQILVFACLNFHDSTERVKRWFLGVGPANFARGPGVQCKAATRGSGCRDGGDVALTARPRCIF